MDSLYVRFKFGMPVREFTVLSQAYPQVHDLEFDGGIQGHIHNQRTEGGERLIEKIYTIHDRHKFLDWARNSGLYDEKSLDDLEWLICQEMMKELQ